MGQGCFCRAGLCVATGRWRASGQRSRDSEAKKLREGTRCHDSPDWARRPPVKRLRPTPEDKMLAGPRGGPDPTLAF